MHEALLIADLLRRIDLIAKAEKARRITGLSIRLGALSHLSAEHFIEHFTRASAGTIAEGARLRLSLAAEIDDDNAHNILIESIEMES
jgi:hydrogenase nickel incorporation protein HypA/HybF